MVFIFIPISIAYGIPRISVISSAKGGIIQHANNTLLRLYYLCFIDSTYQYDYATLSYWSLIKLTLFSSIISGCQAQFGCLILLMLRRLHSLIIIARLGGYRAPFFELVPIIATE